MRDFLDLVRRNWATIAALVLAICGVLWPGREDVAARVLTIAAALLGAGGIGAVAGRSAFRAEAARSSVVASRRI